MTEAEKQNLWTYIYIYMKIVTDHITIHTQKYTACKPPQAKQRPAEIFWPACIQYLWCSVFENWNSEHNGVLLQFLFTPDLLQTVRSLVISFILGIKGPKLWNIL